MAYNGVPCEPDSAVARPRVNAVDRHSRARSVGSGPKIPPVADARATIASMRKVPGSDVRIRSRLGSVVPPTLFLRLFGTLDLRLGDTPLSPLGSARGESVLAYLILHSDVPQPRQHLAFRLWPDSAEAQARTNLRHVLHDLRHTLPNANRYLDIQTRTAQWKPVAPVWLDVLEFDHAAHAASANEPRDTVIASLRSAVELYRGGLLASCYDEWIGEHRDRRRQIYLDCLERLATLLADRGDHPEAIRYAEHLLQHEPLREDAYRLLLRLHHARGDRASAAAVYDACVTTLERELGVGPSPVTREAYEGLVSSGERHGRGVRDTERRARKRHDHARPPLVGRTDEWTRLTDLWRSVEHGRAQLLLVSGEPGVGKTRIVEELRAWCALRGAVTVEARSYAAEGGLAYAPLATWLRAPTIERAVLHLDRGRLSELSRLLPELRSRVEDLTPPQPVPEDDHRHRLFDAAVQAFRTLGTPLVLVADDIQWCDAETLRFLHYLLRSASNAPLLVAATARPETADTHPPLRDLVRGLRTLDLVSEVELGRLSRGATRDLAASVASRALDADDTEALFRETGGNPLFIIEAMRAGWARERASADALTPRVQAVIAARLAQLSEPTRELVGLAATLGRAFSADLLSDAAEMPPAAVARGLDELWRARLVGEHAGGEYDFSHDGIREVAYLALTPPTRRHFHLRVASALKQRTRHGDGTMSGVIAVHYDRAGMATEAMRWYEAAAEASQELYASADAVRTLTRALELLQTLLPTPERHARELAILTAMLMPLANVEGFASPRLTDIQVRSSVLARTLGVDPPPRLVRSLAVSSLTHDDFSAARRHGEQLRDRGRMDADDALLVEAEYLLGIAAFWKGDLADARHHFEQAVHTYRPDRRRAHLLQFWLDPQVICLSRLGNTLWFLGDATAACRARDDALALATEISHEHSRRTALVFAAVLALDMSDTDALRRYVAMLESGLSEHDMRPARVAARAFRAYLNVLEGIGPPGIEVIRESIGDLRTGSHAPGHRAMMMRLLIAAHDAAGDARGRLAAAEDAVAMAGAASLWEAEAHRARAESLAELGAPRAEIASAIDRALAVARRQGAVALEQRAAATLIRLQRSLN